MGGGIYTKAADVGADLVGKVEAGIPEDDPRNPATIADNVGDVAGLGSDLLESYVATIIGAIVLGASTGLVRLVMLPLYLAGFGVLLSIVGTLFARMKEDGNPQMAHTVRERTDRLDAVGNTTAAIGKGFAIGSAALTALALFVAYEETVGLKAIDITHANLIAGVLFGGMLPYLFSSLVIGAVGKTAFRMIEEVRRQFREIPGLLEGRAKADYVSCVDIATTSAIERMVIPGVLAAVVPVLVGFLGDAEMLGGVLVGTMISGVILALFMAASGGAWDNAKKHIENGAFGGKGSAAHNAAVIGDTVGDPFKDTAGPSMDILIKIMSVVSLIIAPIMRGA